MRRTSSDGKTPRLGANLRSSFDPPPISLSAANDPPNKPVEPLQTTNAAAFMGKHVPDRSWHVPDMVPVGTVTLLYGDGGVGKSLLALQLAVSTVLGTYWAGKPVTRGPCLFLSAEDDMDELHRRLAEIAAAEHIEMGCLTDLQLCSLAGEDAVIGALDKRLNTIRPTDLFRSLEARIASSEPALVVLDTLADLFGGDENSRPHARQFIGLLRGIARRHDTTLLVLAHPSVAGMANGSGTSGVTAWSNSARSRLYFDREKVDEDIECDQDARLLTTKKANYSRTGETVRMRWDRGVFKLTEMIEESESREVELSRSETIFIKLLREYTDQGRTVSDARGSAYAPAMFAKDEDAAGIQKAGFARAMGRLFKGGKIAVEKFGPPSRQQRRLVVAE